LSSFQLAGCAADNSSSWREFKAKMVQSKKEKCLSYTYDVDELGLV